MREYIAPANLRHALLLGGTVTLMAVPRLVQAGVARGALLGATLAGMTLVAGAATAWSGKAGMCGVFPKRRRALYGLLAAALLGTTTAACLLPLDPLLRGALVAAGRGDLAALTFPRSGAGALALLLWGAGLETLFFQAGALAFFARLTGSTGISIAAATALRGFVAYRQLAAANLSDLVLLVVAVQMARALIGCLLYARAGLPAAAAFSATVDARHLLWPE